MAKHAEAAAKARLLELVVRAAFVPDVEHERRLTDWAALRYLAQAGAAGRTQAGLANYLGIAPDCARLLVARLHASGDVVDGSSEGHALELTGAGRAVLAYDPIETLSRAVGALPDAAQTELVCHLEVILGALGSSRPAPRHH